MKRSHSYYVVMQDYGKLGYEATVQPEITRREVVSRIKSGEYKMIEFIHFVETGNFVEDVTAELIDEAEAQLKEEYWAHAEAQAALIDHARDLREHAEAAE